MYMEVRVNRPAWASVIAHRIVFSWWKGIAHVKAVDRDVEAFQTAAE